MSYYLFFFLQYQCALLFDAVLLFATAVKEAIRSINLPSPNSTCENSLPWEAGATLYNYLNTVETRGLTGLTKLQHGRRLDFRLDILELKESGLEKSGIWVLEKGANVSTKRYKGGVFGNKTLVVSTLLEPPYVIMKEDQKKRKLYGNERFEGFCIDLLNEIAKIEGFDYTIELVPDGRYGIYDKATKQWDGMVRQLIDRKADMAIAALTISYEREQYIDFTKPFLNLGISILFKKPRPEKPGLFSFLNPLALDIWIYIVAAYILVSFTIFVLARFSPYEWYNPHPCNQDTDSVENAFTLSNSFWFTVGTLMQQGSDVNPRAVSTRIVGGTWWFFTLIIISSYTANLAAFLTVERMVSPIENVDDLSRQTEIAYGTLAGGSTMTFFKDSKIETYQRMWNFMESKEPSVFTKTYEEGIQRVLQGKYAFFMESTAIEYITQRNCQLMQVGGFLDSKGYGIATPINSPLKDRLSMAILSLQEEGKIQVLYNKWWISTGMCNKDDKDNKANSLGVENVGGVFVVLIGGLTLAICIAILEFTWKSKRNAKEDKQSLCSEMAEELGFAVRCLGSSQKPRFKRRCSTCRGTIPHSSHCSIRENPPIDSPNGIIQMRELHASPNQGRRFDLEYGREPIRKFSAGSYLHIDCSDTDA
ncbi:hypothetical protein CHS0354_033669 [Potamilus streckersoni]|uniref:Glutamate receptor n=1 Tax=Potamilus streckersoni TaxID=2493646 RepID=A0AAE0S2B5_9BIVA|nr:hypothetical protein CHS0354_033669 [Potamilus streckersoni]